MQQKNFVLETCGGLGQRVVYVVKNLSVVVELNEKLGKYSVINDNKSGETCVFAFQRCEPIQVL